MYCSSLVVFDRNFLRGESEELREFLQSIHAETEDNSGIFGNLWSQNFIDVWNKTDELVAMIRATDLVTPFQEPGALNIGQITSQLKLVARLINIRNERGNGINRDVFYCEMGGYDAHFQLDTIMENKVRSTFIQFFANICLHFKLMIPLFFLFPPIYQ